MSAGGISFDCLSTSRKVTLPSTDMWGTNMNILKDPNKGIFTRRKDKVGETQEILLSQEDSGDRIAECINVYARGVNPMVGVSYNNYGNNGGQSALSRGHGGTKLPYRPEVFRPPVFRQEDLVPLSRQPRTWFYALTNPQMPNTIHDMQCPDAKSSIQTKKLYHEAPSNKQYIKELPPEMKEDFDRKEVMDKVLFSTDKQTNPSLPSAGSSNEMVSHLDSKHIDRNRAIYEMFSNKTSSAQKNGTDFDLSTLKTQDILRHGSVKTNKGQTSHNQTHMLTESFEKKGIQNRLKGTVASAKSSKLGAQSESINREPRKEGQLPRLKAEMMTQPRIGIEKNTYQSSTTGKINPDMLSLKDGIRTIKNSSVAKQLHLDPGNIRTKPTPCIPVQSVKSNNIHRASVPTSLETIKMKENYNIPVDSGKFTERQSNTGMVDLSSLPTKNVTMIPKEATKTFYDQELQIGERPQHRLRVLQTEMDTGGNKMEVPRDFYETVQGADRQDIARRTASVGGFDPRPQNVYSEELATARNDYGDSSMIDHRQERLQHRANQEFQARF